MMIFILLVICINIINIGCTTTDASTPEIDPMVTPPPDESNANAELTDVALSSLFNESIANGSTPSEAHQNSILRYEWLFGLRHFGDQDTLSRSCFIISTTYQNAMKDLRRYYSLRYVYYENVEYEVGYVTHQIILKYQIVLEIFHLIQRKYFYNMDRMFATPSYMLYMYTNILYQCTDIIHLCNMLHEIEAKYRLQRSKGPFAEDEVSKSSRSNRTKKGSEDAVKSYQDKLEQMKKKFEREQRQKMKMIRKGKLFQVTRFTTKKPKRNWDLQYGWSIEDW